jgi:hypothetical protein
MSIWKVLLVLGGIVLLLGVSLIAGGLQGYSHSETFSITAGEEWFSYFDIDMAEGASVSGEFLVLSGGTITYYFLDQTNYDGYLNGGPWSALASVSGSSGKLTGTAPRAGKYYLVFEHGPGYGLTEQSVRVSFTISGIDSASMVTGAAVAVVGGGMLAAGAVMRQRSLNRSRAVLSRLQASGVILFGGAAPTESLGELPPSFCSNCGAALGIQNPPPTSCPGCGSAMGAV